MKTGMIGLGVMGLGMANNVAQAGFLTSVYNRTENKAKAFGKTQGITVSSSPQQLAEQVDIVLICVTADEDVLQMVTAVAETIKPESIVIDMSTVSSNTAKIAAALLVERQVFFLDAPVSGGVEGAKNGTLATMVGGDEKAFKKAYPVLQAMSSRIIHMGETGSGQNTKAVNQIMAAGINQAVSEALAFANAQGLSLEKVIEIISAGAAGNWFLQHKGSNMINGIYEPGFKLALHHKDLKICQQMAQQEQLSSYMIDRTLTDYEILMERGFGDEDISALYRLKNLIEK